MSKSVRMNRNKIKPYRFTTNYYRKIKNATVENIEGNQLICPTNIQTSTGLNININEPCSASEPEINSEPHKDFEFLSFDPEEDDFDRNEEEKLEDRLSLVNQLMQWALSNKLTLKSVSELLKILRAHGMTELPKDGRTLLKTPPVTDIIEMGTGQFWHSGIEINLLNALWDIQQPMTISLIFNIDGMSPFNSSTYQFWPISFIIENILTYLS